MHRSGIVLVCMLLALLPSYTAAQCPEYLPINFDDVTTLDEYGPWRGVTFENVMIWAVPQYPPLTGEDDTEGGAMSYPNGICAGNCYSGVGRIYFSTEMQVGQVSIWALSGPGIDFLSSNVRIVAYSHDGDSLGVAEAADNVQNEQLTIIAAGIGRIDLYCGGEADSWDDLELIGCPVVSTEKTTFGGIKLKYR